MQKDLTWKMEVVEMVERGEIVGYALRGHPSDLAWYEEGKQRSEYVIVQFGPDKFYKTDDLKALQRLKDETDSLNGLAHEAQLILDFPLLPGKRFGELEQVNRTDGRYCWVVEQDKRILSKRINGVPSSEMIPEYTLHFVTLPDHVIVDFAPGVGITRYEYVHHGTVSEVNVKLVEYHPGTVQR